MKSNPNIRTHAYHADAGSGSGKVEPPEEDPSSPKEDEAQDAQANGNEPLIPTIRSWVRATLFGRNSESLREALEEVIEEHDDEALTINPEEKLMLHNILAFGELEVHDVMVPRPDVVGVPCDISLEQLKAVIAEEGHTRMPVYRDTLDTIEGFIHIKDLIRYIGDDGPFDIKEVSRPMLAVPPSMKVVDLLVRMRSTGMHMALVVDEYGGTDGILTLEDLFEEIVGDIHDEYDEDEKGPLFRRISKNIAVVDARIEVELLEEHLNLRLGIDEEEDDFQTLGGLIFTLVGKVPAVGEKIKHNGLLFEIVDADGRRINKVRIMKSSDYREEED